VRRPSEAKLVAVLLGAHRRAGQASALRLLPHPLLQRIVEMSFQPHDGSVCKLWVKLGVSHTPCTHGALT
jgi:hypothetical protein